MIDDQSKDHRTLLMKGAAAGLLASVVQAGIGKAEDLAFLSERENSHFAPRLVRRLAESGGYEASTAAAWLFGSAFHLAYAAFWGGVYAAAREHSVAPGHAVTPGHSVSTGRAVSTGHGVSTRNAVSPASRVSTGPSASTGSPVSTVPPVSTAPPVIPPQAGTRSVPESPRPSALIPWVGGSVLGGLIWAITFPDWGGAVRTRTERSMRGRTWGLEVVAASVAVGFGLCTAHLYERFR